MLPFLKEKESSASLPVDTIKRNELSEESEMDLLEIAIKELFEAQNDKDRAQAFRAAFQLLEQEPHEEYNGEHADSESTTGI